LGSTGRTIIVQAFLAAGFQKVITYFDVPEISEPIFVSSHRYSWSYYRVCKSDFSSNRPPAAGHREAGLTGINIGIRHRTPQAD